MRTSFPISTGGMLTIPIPSPAADDFLATLDNAHHAIQFTMQMAVNNKLPFVGMVIINSDNRLNSCLNRKKTNKGLHYESHIGNRYKRSLLRTTIGRASRLSFSPELFRQECKELKSVFVKLKYPEKLIDFTFARFKATLGQNQDSISLVDNPVRIVLPFKDRKSADCVRRELRNVSRKIGHVLQPAFTKREISEDVKAMEIKRPLVNQQCVVYEFKCNAYDANYIGYTSCHLLLRIDEHRYSVSGKRLKE